LAAAHTLQTLVSNAADAVIADFDLPKSIHDLSVKDKELIQQDRASLNKRIGHYLDQIQGSKEYLMLHTKDYLPKTSDEINSVVQPIVDRLSSMIKDAKSIVGQKMLIPVDTIVTSFSSLMVLISTVDEVRAREIALLKEDALNLTPEDKNDEPEEADKSKPAASFATKAKGKTYSWYDISEADMAEEEKRNYDLDEMIVSMKLAADVSSVGVVLPQDFAHAFPRLNDSISLAFDRAGIQFCSTGERIGTIVKANCQSKNLQEVKNALVELKTQEQFAVLRPHRSLAALGKSFMKVGSLPDKRSPDFRANYFVLSTMALIYSEKILKIKVAKSRLGLRKPDQYRQLLIEEFKGLFLKKQDTSAKLLLNVVEAALKGLIRKELDSKADDIQEKYQDIINMVAATPLELATNLARVETRKRRKKTGRTRNDGSKIWEWVTEKGRALPHIRYKEAEWRPCEMAAVKLLNQQLQKIGKEGIPARKRGESLAAYADRGSRVMNQFYSWSDQISEIAKRRNVAIRASARDAQRAANVRGEQIESKYYLDASKKILTSIEKSESEEIFDLLARYLQDPPDHDEFWVEIDSRPEPWKLGWRIKAYRQ
jgi:hypothetical protein